MRLGDMIEELKADAKRLNDLLEDPQPGLMTWVKAVGDAIDCIAKRSPNYKKVNRS